MSNLNAAGKVQDVLNRSSPAAADAKLGDVLADLIAQVNVLTAKNAVLTAKLDLDAGVTDTNYASLAGAGTTVIKDLESRF